MPPKSGKKMSKAEKEKQKKEEAEKKAQEEEEARIAAEKEEAERKEREQVEAEERKRLETEERKKRKGQLQELEELWTSYRSTFRDEQDARRVKAKWDRYMRCDGSPDPTIPGEINTYMNLWRENTTDRDIQTILKESKLMLSLIEELEFLIDDTPPEEITEETVQRYVETISELRQLLKEKLDLGCHDLSLKATDLMDSETLNLQQVISNDVITLCLWGNLSKNPRIKSFEFVEVGFTFEMPKILTLSDIGFRVLFTKYDHLSPYCRSYRTRVKQKKNKDEDEGKGETEGDEAKAEGEEEEKEEEGEEKKEEGEEGMLTREETEGYGSDLEATPGGSDVVGDVDLASSLGQLEYATPVEIVGQEAGCLSEGTVSLSDVMAQLRELEEGDGEEGEKPPEEPQEEVFEEDDYEIKTPEPMEFEDFDGDDDVIDLRAYDVVGGVFYFNLINMPPQPKVANTWTITQLVDPPSLDFNDYEGDPPPETPKESETGEDITKAADKLLSMKMEVKKEEEPKKKEPEKPDIPVIYKLPPTVYFSEEPQVVRWDDAARCWRTNGFSDQVFKEEERLLSFKTRYFGTMALVQDKHINMPFQSWELRPRAANHALFNIIAAIIEVEIEIKDDKVRLISPDDRSELAHLLNNYMSVNEFVKAMRLAGVNLFPDEDSPKYVSIQNKNSITEERLYQQMAMTSSAMAYSWSRWNSDVKDVEKLVIQGCEQLIDEPLLEEDWSLFLITKKRTTKLKMNEFDETFSDDYAEGTEFHADLYHMAMEVTSEQAKDRIRETNHHFVDTVYSLLKHTNVVTYS